MGSLLHCLRRNCWESDDDERENTRDLTTYDPPHAVLIMNREATSGRIDTRVEGVPEDCCRPPLEREQTTQGSGGLFSLWQKLTNVKYQEVAPLEELASADVSIISPSMLNESITNDRGTSGVLRFSSSGSDRKRSPRSSPKCLAKSPLREATRFETNRGEIPTIHSEEVVLPGSFLQRQMAIHARINLEVQGDECVICMDIFDPSNPRMPTHCGCGENKTFFHLPCLLQWVDQSGRTCPSCRKNLRWEEF